LEIGQWKLAEDTFFSLLLTNDGSMLFLCVNSKFIYSKYNYQEIVYFEERRKGLWSLQ
jgi:hypothetical protein